MLFIDLSLRDPIQGYVDSLELIREAIPDAFDHYADEMRDIIHAYSRADESSHPDVVEELHWVLDEAESRTLPFGYYATPHEGFYYVMTEEEWEAFDV